MGCLRISLSSATCVARYVHTATEHARHKCIQENTQLVRLDCPYLSRFPMYLMTPECALWTASYDEAMTYPFPEPFWAFCWPGSYAIARYLLENPNEVKDRNVLDFASGCGVASIVSMHLGANMSCANDIDEWACSASLLNWKLNRVHFGNSFHNSFTVDSKNLIGKSGCFVNGKKPDVVLAGDVCYDERLADTVMNWFEDLISDGVRVLIGDPGRQFLPFQRLHKVAEYDLPKSLTQENYGLQNGAVWSL